MADLNKCVIVGAFAENGELDFDVHGPFTLEQATDFQRDVQEVWDKQPADSFEFGKPTVQIHNLLEKTHPFYSRAAQAAANWYTDKENA